MPVARAKEEIDSAEFTDWIEFNKLDPYGQWRGDAQAGIIAATIANANRSKGPSFKPEDFMMTYGPPKRKEMSGDQMMALFGAFAEAHNASIGCNPDGTQR